MNVNFDFILSFFLFIPFYFHLFYFRRFFWVSKLLGTFYCSFKVNNRMSDNNLNTIDTVLTQQIIAVVQTSPVYILYIFFVICYYAIEMVQLYSVKNKTFQNLSYRFLFEYYQSSNSLNNIIFQL